MIESSIWGVRIVIGGMGKMHEYGLPLLGKKKREYEGGVLVNMASYNIHQGISTHSTKIHQSNHTSIHPLRYMQVIKFGFWVMDFASGMIETCISAYKKIGGDPPAVDEEKSTVLEYEYKIGVWWLLGKKN